MPKRLPLWLVIRGTIKNIIFGLLLGIRYAIVFACWSVLLPWMTAQPMRMYFGLRFTWIEDTLISNIPEFAKDIDWMPLRVTSDCLFGLLLVFTCICLLLGLVLMHEYMRTNGLFDFIRHVPETQPVKESESAEDNTEDYNNDGVEEDDQQLINETPGNWLDKVSPREYRAFLRRREYHRERSEKLRVRHHEAQSLKNAEILRMIDAGLSEVEASSNWETASNEPTNMTTSPSIDFTERTAAETFDPYNLDAMTNTSIGDFTEASRRTNANLMTATGQTNGVTFRESFRCRICNKRSCVNREHVIQASQMNNAPTAPPQQPVPPVPDFQHQQQQQPQLEVRDLQAIDEVDMREFRIPIGFGADSSFLEWFKFFIGFLVFSQLLVHVLMVVPYSFGQFILTNELPNGLYWIKEMFLEYFGTDDENAIYIPLIKELGLKLSHALLSTGSDIFDVMVNNQLITKIDVSNVTEFMKKALPLVFWKPGVIGFTIIKLFLGYLVFNLIGWIEFYIVMRVWKPSNNRNMFLECFYIPLAFFKLLAVNGTVMFVFPVYSGWLLDICTLGLFKESLLSRLQQFHDYPIISTLLHFIPGLLFSLALSSLVIQLRKVLRPGLLHWIRNPDDPEDRWVKDVLNKTYISQMIQICPTFFFYACIIGTFFGATSKIICLAFPSIAPLRFSLSDPLKVLPGDFILQGIAKALLNLINPWTFTSIIPAIYRWMLKKLKLSSYYFGGRYLSEESIPRGGRWAFVPDFDRLYSREKMKIMSKKLPQPLDVAKIPIKEGKPIVSVQQPINEPPGPRRFRPVARKEKESATKGFTVVFRPHYLFARNLALYFATFVLWTASVFLFFVAPIMTGRWIISSTMEGFGFSSRDSYALMIGTVVLGVAARIISDVVKGLYSSDSVLLRKVFIDGPTCFGKFLVVATFIVAIWPSLIGVYLYFILGLNPELQEIVLSIGLIPFWTAGMAIVRVMIMSPSPPFYLSERSVAAVKKLRDDGFSNIDLEAALKNLFLPLTFKMALFLVEPILYIWAARPFFNFDLARVPSLQSKAVALALLRPHLIMLYQAIRSYRQRILDQIRNEHYLVGNRLHNHGEAVPPSPATTRSYTIPQYR